MKPQYETIPEIVLSVNVKMKFGYYKYANLICLLHISNMQVCQYGKFKNNSTGQLLIQKLNKQTDGWKYALICGVAGKFIIIPHKRFLYIRCQLLFKSFTTQLSPKKQWGRGVAEGGGLKLIVFVMILLIEILILSHILL